jgi:DNA-binding transcriptional regulator YhcF (GntR family)
VTERGKGTFVASTPGESEMLRIRQEKLQALVNALFEETKRLGYSRDEVRHAVEERTRSHH